MTISAKIICDSVNSNNSCRLTTMELRYPRFIHSEFMTHRAFSRNAESSRARPFNLVMGVVESDPVVPLVWGREQSGMQTGEPYAPGSPEAEKAEEIWLETRNYVVRQASRLWNIGSEDGCADDAKIHKSLVNRMLEPWSWITVVCTATEWSNFFRLRLHGDAEVHFQALAGVMKTALDGSVPVERMIHLPYFEGTGFDRLVDGKGNMTLTEFAAECTTINGFTESSIIAFVNRYVAVDGPFESSWLNLVARVSTARCSRVSYLKQGRVPTLVEDLAQFERLVTGSGFGHWSPHEHIGYANDGSRSGNFVGWTQYRKLFAGECG